MQMRERGYAKVNECTTTTPTFDRPRDLTHHPPVSSELLLLALFVQLAVRMRTQDLGKPVGVVASIAAKS